ncbi:MAG: hypothetical protein JWO82_2011 [Akkermansiaceae bacterium]|nr:hypothetical protein [Akkermansiaceae bacterium]
MGGMNSLYLETGAEIAGLDALVTQHFGPLAVKGPSSARYQSFSGWFVKNYAGFGATLAAFSAQVPCDVVLFAYQSTVDAFAFFRCRGGTVVRALVFGCGDAEGEWELAEGAPEEWELPMMFSEAELTGLLEYAESDAERELLRARWETLALEAGDFSPRPPDPHGLAAYLEFPDYG